MQVWFDKAEIPADVEKVYEKKCNNPKCSKVYWTTSRNQKYCCDECSAVMKVVVKKKSKRKAERRKAYEENAEINKNLSAAYALAHKVADLYNVPKRCACHGCGCNGPLQLHHKNLNPFDNSPWNLVWVCASHHKAVHDLTVDINMVDTYNEACENAKFADEDGYSQLQAKCDYVKEKLSTVENFDEVVAKVKENSKKAA